MDSWNDAHTLPMALTFAQTPTNTRTRAVKPLEVTIIAPKRSFSAGVRSELVCRSSGSRPPAQITWWKNGSTRLVTSEPHASVRQTQSPDGNVSLSSLSFVASPEDDGSLISCRVHNLHIANEPMEQQIRLSVHCKHFPCSSVSRLRPSNLLHHWRSMEGFARDFPSSMRLSCCLVCAIVQMS